MIFYVSGNYNNAGNQILEWLVEIDAATLTSFAYKSMVRDRTPLLANYARSQGKRIKYMLDSGAFTAWSNGKKIDLDQLIDTANELQDKYSDCIDFIFVALDEIPGSKGRATTEEDCKTACLNSAKNYEAMRDRIDGIVKPVFHTGDPDWLIEDAYADAEYIGIGMSQNLSEQDRISFAADIVKKYPEKKMHGLAATGFKMMRAAAWHSVDSAAWQYAASMGSINWLRPDGRLLAIPISNESPKQKESDQHFRSLPGITQGAIEAAVTDFGLTINELASNYAARWKWNVVQYRRAVDYAALNKQAYHQGGLF